MGFLGRIKSKSEKIIGEKSSTRIKDEMSKEGHEKIEIEIDSTTKKALSELTSLLSDDKEIEDIQNAIYQIAKGSGIEPRDFFKVLYQIILSTTRGPKIGPFIMDIGRKNVAAKLNSYI